MPLNILDNICQRAECRVFGRLRGVPALRADRNAVIGIAFFGNAHARQFFVENVADMQV